MTASTSAKYIAVISPVREVTLVLDGDLTYWQEQLPNCGLHVFDNIGRAELIISSISSKWIIFPFCELTISLQISQQSDGNSRDGFYFLQAYNSSGLLAWCERTFFRTPYRPAKLAVQVEPVETVLSDPRLHMARAPRSDGMETVAECWEGAIYLPPANPKQPRFERFFAKLEGPTEVCPFDPARDTFECAADFGRFLAPREWHVRRAGIHSRSKTFPVPQATGAG